MIGLILEAILAFVLVLIAIVIVKRDKDMKNSLILFWLLFLALVYLWVNKPFSFEEELFILVGMVVIDSIVGIMAFMVHKFLGESKRPGETSGVRTYFDEIKRKAFHFVSFLMFVPWGIYFNFYRDSLANFNVIFGTNIQPMQEGILCYLVFLVTFSLLFLFTLIEFLRLMFYPKLFARLLRPYEFDRFASYLYSTASIFMLSLFIYPQDAAFAAALVIGFLADLAACLVGMRFRRFLYNDRSLEGGLANFIVGAMAGYYFIGWLAIPVALIIAIFDFLNGALDLNLNDNLMFPLLAGFVIKAISIVS